MFKLTCLSGCGYDTTASSREDVGVLVMEHMADEHDTPVDPLEAGELALKTYDDAPRWN
ncbi:DUF1059 domain-containing protein [Haloferax namakaokahaiae]|uniref:DUF1059 domain-containing protein n=1 Tax=Haloferax namakaokahaiae TaxID=1748331 RepID=A0ABD5ZBC8_9EURY